jgi:hypothetical protein
MAAGLGNEVFDRIRAAGLKEGCGDSNLANVSLQDGPSLCLAHFLSHDRLSRPAAT